MSTTGFQWIFGSDYGILPRGLCFGNEGNSMRFSRRQMGVVIACVAIYTTAYLNRLNLSAVLGSLTDELKITSAQAGLLQTFFAAVYAAGQFVNGAVVDRVNPRKYLLAGLAGTAVCNALMGMSVSYGMLLSLCLLRCFCLLSLQTTY